MARKKKQGPSIPCLRRSSHHKATGKYVRQYERTAANKARRIAKNKKKGA